MSEIKLGPQPGPQERFLSSNADIVIYGGAAGGGKSYGLLLEPIRHINNQGFGAVCFRRVRTNVTKQGGLWDTASQIYPLLGGEPRRIDLSYHFPSGAKVQFAQLQYETDLMDWKSAQVPLIMFDELTEFSEQMFFYMFSRNRSVCGVRPYIRATCNPEPSSWVLNFIRWWIGDDGLPIPERDGVIRWYVRFKDNFIWSDDPGFLQRVYKKTPKSVTFIKSTIDDNQILLKQDPGYRDNLENLSEYDRQILLLGNWHVKKTGGMFFRKEYFEVTEIPKCRIVTTIRYWDRAATEVSESNKDPDWTVGLKLAKLQDGRFAILDVVRFRSHPEKVYESILNIAKQDGIDCTVGIEQDPGQAGKVDVKFLQTKLSGFQTYVNRVDKKKIIRASPVASQAKAGNILIQKGQWNDDFITELQNFPSKHYHDDQVDSLTGAFSYLTMNNVSTPKMYSISY